MGADEVDVPGDWYRTGFPLETIQMPWSDRTEAEVERALGMLRPVGGERVLDLACGIGRHSVALAKRGFEVVGVDISEDLLTIAHGRAQREGVDIELRQTDLRELELDEEFDIVLSLNDGAVGYFETDEENLRTFSVVAAALSGGGKHLMQLPNVLHAEANLPRKSWVVGEQTLELSDHHWNAEARYIEGSTVPIAFGEVFKEYKPIPFRQRLYSAEELAEIYADVEMELTNTFSGSGKPRRPKKNQYEIFVEGRKRYP